ncbi:protein Lines homolog 1 isoform X2 [Lingula anatina]|uniref:Protein Lines homolog 1 isoform X2 n=1 Tax=Lingula anatina TaxID=7574 RepID=A0A1S3IZW8_LINAN|nr:protein Lines homolog 1 isoform X2 [Lingula anatina]|eukprot:XP_013403094.1 protein Lines homolog 1 isoform X2 [Lingula anatina]
MTLEMDKPFVPFSQEELTALYQLLLKDVQSITRYQVIRLLDIQRTIDTETKLPSSVETLMLLQLTDLKVLFDKCRGHSSLRQLVNSVLVEHGMVLQILSRFLKSPDKYIRYAANNAAQSALKCLPAQSVFAGFFEALDAALKAESESTGYVFELFHRFLSDWKRGLELPKSSLIRTLPAPSKGNFPLCQKQHTQESDGINSMLEIDINTVSNLLTIVDKHWNSVVPNLMDKWHRWNNLTQESFLSLWLAIVKLSLNSKVKQILGSGITEHKCLVFVYTDPDILLDALACTSMKQRFIRRKIIDIYLCCLGHPDGLDNQARTESLALMIQQRVAEGWLKKLHLPKGFAGFGGTSILASEEYYGSSDISLLRYICLLVLKSSAALEKIAEKAHIIELVGKCLDSVLQFSSDTLQTGTTFTWCQLLQEIFIDQDDLMVEAMLYLLVVYLRSQDSSPNPHLILSLFLSTISHDHTVLLDMLISPETCFLVYLVKYLKLVQHDWMGFQSSLGKDSTSSLADMLLISKESAKSGNCSFWTSEESHSSGKKITNIVGNDELHEKTSADRCKTVSSKSKDTSHMESKCGFTATVNLVDYSDSESEQDYEGELERNSMLSVRESALDQTLGVFIRLKMSLERMSVQNLIPFNVHPLLKLISQVECLYER